MAPPDLLVSGLLQPTCGHSLRKQQLRSRASRLLVRSSSLQPCRLAEATSPTVEQQDNWRGFLHRLLFLGSTMSEEATSAEATSAEGEPSQGLSPAGTLRQRGLLLGVLIVDSIFIVLAALVFIITTALLARLPLAGLDLLVVRICQVAFAISTIGFLVVALAHDFLIAVARLWWPRPQHGREGQDHENA